MTGRVDYSEFLFEAGLIEADLETRIVGWVNEEELVRAGMAPIMTFGSTVPVAWLCTGCSPCPEPQPIEEVDVVWRWVE